jgi:oxalate decarboxylase/phosphoglucose isomerase-like protein (cupin superfamily)
MSEFTRRSFLGKTAVAIGSVAALQRVVGADRSKTDPGPANKELDAQNPDSMWPPDTDSKSLVQNFKYPFSFANKRTYEGGWSREVTIRELPVSKTMAGVNMRLTAGGVRELHWHTSGEWAIMLYGTARITAIDADGKSFVADTKKYDLWFFPSGIPHSIQGLNPDGCEFMLVFDDGNFSESETVLLSDSMAHLPPEVLSKNFGVGEQAFANIPKQELFIFQTDVPGGLEADRKAAAGALGKSPKDFAFRTMEMPPTKQTKGGEVRIVDSKLQSLNHGHGHGHRSSGRNAGTALAPERGRVAVLYHWQGTNDCGGDRQQSSDDGLSGGRRRVRGQNAAALHREHGGYRPHVPGNVQERSLSGSFVIGMARAHSTGTGHGAPAHR